MKSFKTVPLLGLSLAKGWAQVCSTDNQQLTLSLALQGENAKNFGKELCKKITSNKISTAQQLHQFLLDTINGTRKNNLQLQATACLIENNTLTVACYAGIILLKRDEQVKPVIFSDQKLKLIQGKIKPQDCLALATKQAMRNLPQLPDELQQTNDYEKIKQQLEISLQKEPDSSLSAVALAEIKEAQKIEKVEKIDAAIEPQIEKEKLESVPKIEEKEEKIEIPEPKKEIEKPSTNKPNAPGFEPLSSQIERKRQELIHKKNKRTIGQIAEKYKEIFKHNSYKLKKPFKHLWRKSQQLTHNFINKIKTLKLTSILAATKKISKKILKFTQFMKKIDFNKLKIWQKKPSEIYLHQYNKKKVARRTLLILFPILMIVAAGLWWNQQRQLTIKQTQESLQPALELYQTAQQLQENEIIAARNKTEQAINTLAKLKKDQEGNRLATSLIDEKLEEFKNFYQDINTDAQLDELEIFYNLRQIDPTFISSDLTSNQQYLILLDKEKQKLALLDQNTQETQLIELEQGTQARDIIADGNNVYLLGQGIYQLSIPEEITQTASVKQIKEQGDSDREAIALGLFNSYLYVFNPEKRNIYRYIIQDNDLSDPIGWLIDKTGLEFEQINSMSINGQIWLSSQTGEILQYEKGEPVPLNLDVLEPNLEQITDIYTQENLDYIFVLDAQNQKVIIFTQQGELLQQVIAPNLAGATQITVNAENNQLFVLNGSLVYNYALEIE